MIFVQSKTMGESYLNKQRWVNKSHKQMFKFSITITF